MNDAKMSVRLVGPSAMQTEAVLDAMRRGACLALPLDVRYSVIYAMWANHWRGAYWILDGVRYPFLVPALPDDICDVLPYSLQ